MALAPSRVTGGLGQSSSTSGIFFHGDGQSQAVVNSYLSSSFGNSSNSIPGTGRPSPCPVSGNMNNMVFSSVANSAPSVGASSMVTDANSTLSGGPHLQRSSSVVNGSSAIQQMNHRDPSVRQVQQSQQQHDGSSSATSLPTPQNGLMPVSMGARASVAFPQDPGNLSQVQKPPRLDIKHEDIIQQQVLQQLLQRQDSMQLQTQNPQIQTLLRQQRLRQQQQFLQSIPPSQRVHLQQQQQQQQQPQQQQQLRQPASAVKRPYDGGICARRLMQYLYHQRQRPAENSIAYWKKFVAEYFSPRAKKRWCLSLYDNVGHHALGVFPQVAMEAWRCDICGSKSGRGFEATFEVLPRLAEIKFGSGVIDELLFLDLPREFRFPSGIMMLECAQAVQESVYEQLRVVREGQLRIIFSQELKILSWEFCARRHEELLPRRVVAPQVNQLLQVAQKCQSTINEGGSDGVSQQDLQTNRNMVVTAGRQLAKCLEIPSLNDLGFSKRYVRCLQISEVVNSMKDLIDFCRDRKVGPIEGLKNYPRRANAAKLQMQKMQELEQQSNLQGLPTDTNVLNKLISLHPGVNNQLSSTSDMVGRSTLSSPAQAALVLSNYQNMLVRQNSANSNPDSLQHDSATTFNSSNQSPASNFQGPAAFMQGPMQKQNLSGSGISNYIIPPQPVPHPRRSLSNDSLLLQNNQQSSRGNQALQQQMLQLLQQVSNNDSPVQQHSLGGQNGHGNQSRNGFGFGSTSSAAPASLTAVTVPAPTRSNSFKAPSNSDSSAGGGNIGFNQKLTDLPHNLHFQDDIVQDIANELTENGFFDGSLDDNMGFGWKA